MSPRLLLGAGREKKEPKGLTEVTAGGAGPPGRECAGPPGQPVAPGRYAGSWKRPMQRGDTKDLPFKIMPHNDVGLWGAAANEVVKMRDEGVWAVLGTIDDVNSHVAIRVALKLEIPWVNTRRS